MDWIALLKSQQADLIKRLKKQKAYELALLQCEIRGCHSEITSIGAEPLEKMQAVCQQKAEVIAQNPPPTPLEYNFRIDFRKHFQSEAYEYLLREQVVVMVVSDRLGKLMKKVPVDTVANMILDDEGNLRGESKFPYVLTADPTVSIQVHACDGESINSLKKDKVRWSVTQEDIKNHQVLIFLCILWSYTADKGYTKGTIMTGFLPTSQISFSGPKIYLGTGSLLYAGGLSAYLESLIAKKDTAPGVDQIVIPETIQTLPEDHPLAAVVDAWECSQMLTGQTGAINCISFSPGGKILASGSRGETKLWDLTTGEPNGTLSEYPWIEAGQLDEVNALAFSPDGQTLVSGGADSTIKIWHVGAKDLIDILKKHNAKVRCLGFSPDGKTLASGGDDRKIQFWDLHKRGAVSALSLDDSAAHSLAFSPDGQMLATGSYRKIKVWRLDAKWRLNKPAGELVYILTGHSHIVSSVAFSRDGKLLVSGSRDKTIKIWQLENGELIRTLKGHTDAVYAIALSPDGQTIASGSADKTIKLWHLETGELLGTFTGHAGVVSAVAFSPDGQMLASASLDKTIKIWQQR